jgi:NADH-quinone oxidoreductase subunit E
LIETCKNKIAHAQHHVSADGKFSWEEVECMGACANAPMVQVNKDTYEDLTPAALEAILDMFAAGETPVAGSQTGRKASCPEGGPTTLTDSSLYDGSTIGAWRKRFDGTDGAAATVVAAAGVRAAGAGAASTAGSAAATAPAVNPAALAAMANAGLVKELNERGGGKPMSADELAKLKMSAQVPLSAVDLAAVTAAASAGAVTKPELLTAPRGGKADDLGLIWGVADKLAERLNGMGIWHFDQIAKWTDENIAWFENEAPGFKGRIARDKWIEQCQKLASGWRPGTDAGERPKG